MKMSLQKADFIICDSEHTKKDVIKIIGYRKNIKVIYIAADKTFKPYTIKKSPHSVLYIGSNLAHKNLETLLKAFSLVKKKIPESRLILIGGSLVKDKALHILIKQLNMAESVKITGYVENIAKEYSKATLTVVPSLYEGFGLPVLEAMACGCPVICSDKTSLPEVGGDAVLYFDGHNIDDLAHKMYKVLTHEKLQREMRKEGIEQARKFSWEKTAKETIEVYKKL